jgi:hypothetical protein
MIKSILAGLIFTVSTYVGAQSINSGDLENLCKSTEKSDRTACMLIVKVYMDGFLEGVAKGVIDTYKYDEELFDIVKNEVAKNIVPRINKVVSSSTCIQKVSVDEMISSYLYYIKRNTSMRQENYRNSMTRAIILKHCKK